MNIFLKSNDFYSALKITFTLNGQIKNICFFKNTCYVAFWWYSLVITDKDNRLIRSMFLFLFFLKYHLWVQQWFYLEITALSVVPAVWETTTRPQRPVAEMFFSFFRSVVTLVLPVDWWTWLWDAPWVLLRAQAERRQQPRAYSSHGHCQWPGLASAFQASAHATASNIPLAKTSH